MKRILLVDGYNIIHAWPELARWKEAAGFDAARDRLIASLQDYGGYASMEVVVVFDAYRSGRMKQTVENRPGLDIVFTANGETAAHYIERVADELKGKDCELYVATSDSLEQTIVLGRGAVRLSPRELAEDMEEERRRHRTGQTQPVVGTNALMHRLDARLLEELERMRRGGGSET